jgi:hypothetical protein
MEPFAIYKFNQLSTTERFRWIVEEGAYLGVNRYLKDYRVALFSLHGYYVEVYIHSKNGIIGKVRPFFSYKKLDAFLPEVNISEITRLLE